jgi:hypothetical protein
MLCTQASEYDPTAKGWWRMHEEDLLRHWFGSFPPRWMVTPFPMPEPARMVRETLFQEVLDKLEVLKDLFGYEAVYFGIGCKAFPEAILPEPESEPQRDGQEQA